MKSRDVRAGWSSWWARRVAPLALLGYGVYSLTVGITRAEQRDAIGVTSAAGADSIRDGFEGPVRAWRQEESDAPTEIYTQERSRQVAHKGIQSERFEFKAGIGGGLYYSYALPKIPVTPDLAISLYVRANRVGMNFLARVALPADTDPDSQQPSFVLIPGTIYETVDRWQKLELDDMMPAVERQARVLRQSSKRKVSLEGAYLERLVVNIYGGEGLTEVNLDELTIGPLPNALVEAHARRIRGGPGEAQREAVVDESSPTARRIGDRSRRPSEPMARNIPRAAERIKFERNRFTLDGYPWFPTMIRGFDADPTLIRRLGSNVAVVPVDANEEYLDTAIESGLFLMPELGGTSDADPVTGLFQTTPVDPVQMLAAAAGFPRQEHVFAWSIGNHLGEDLDSASRKLQTKKIREAITAIRKAKPGGSPYTTGTVLGMLPEYARIPENLDMIGSPAQTWATMRGPFEPLRYLEQRRLLTARGNGDALIWSEIDVTAPPIYKRMIWGMDRAPAGGIPCVQPEQLRLATYTALAAGCRAICYRADGDLGQGTGRMNSIEVALLNEEIDVLEPILADPDRSITMLPVYNPEPPPPKPISLLQTNISTINKPPTIKEQAPTESIKSAAIPTKDRRGVLLMISDYASYATYQPPQAALPEVRVRAKGVPAEAIAYLISPGGVRPLNSIRVPEGHDISLPDFGLTALILMTTNVELKNQIELAINQNRPRAISLAIEQAQLQRAWVAEVDYKLQQDGHPQRDSGDLIAGADALIKSAQDALAREDYPTAWGEARRVSRPLRILMREHFMSTYDAIIKALNNTNLVCGPEVYDGQEKPQPRLVGPMAVAPLASFNTLPQAWEWLEWIKTGRLDKNVMPSGEFDYKTKDDFFDAGWTSEGYETDDIETKVALLKGGISHIHNEDDEDKGSYLVLNANPRKGLKIDAVVPFADHPTVAVRSPELPVRAGHIYRIAVMANMSNATVPGNGGLIVRDSIGGERFQYRTTQALTKGWFEVVYYRRVPADCNLSVTLGMAGVSGSASFDDLRIQPIVEQVSIEQQQQNIAVRPRRSPLPAPTTYNPDGTPTAPATRAVTTPTRSAARLQPLPIRQ